MILGESQLYYILISHTWLQVKDAEDGREAEESFGRSEEEKMLPLQASPDPRSVMCA